MDVTEEVLAKEKYKKLINQLSAKALEKLANDPVKALEMAYKGVREIEPKRSVDINYIQDQANAIQELAQAILKQRS